MELHNYIKYLPNGYVDYSKVNLEDPPAFLPYKLEEIDFKAYMNYAFDLWYLPIYVGIIYISVIFGIQHWMKDRKPFELKRELFLWNAALGIFSIVGFCRTAPELLYMASQSDGLYKSTCVWQRINMPLVFWGLLFVLSKIVELGDTVFIVLRKKPLQFIQWYHHLITLTVCWITYPYGELISFIFGILNFGVHSLMYPYFALRALDVKIPRSFANLITTLQLVQMFAGLFVNTYTTYLVYSGVECRRHPNSIKMFYFVYGSFIWLFGKLFYNLVVQKRKKA